MFLVGSTGERISKGVFNLDVASEVGIIVDGVQVSRIAVNEEEVLMYRMASRLDQSRRLRPQPSSFSRPQSPFPPSIPSPSSSFTFSSPRRSPSSIPTTIHRTFSLLRATKGRSIWPRSSSSDHTNHPRYLSSLKIRSFIPSRRRISYMESRAHYSPSLPFLRRSNPPLLRRYYSFSLPPRRTRRSILLPFISQRTTRLPQPIPHSTAAQEKKLNCSKRPRGC